MSWRFLRALSCPARIIAAVTPLAPRSSRASPRSAPASSSCAPSGRATASAGSSPSTPTVSVAEARRARRRARRATSRIQRPHRRRGRVRGRRPPAARPPPDAPPAPARRSAGSTVDDAPPGASPFEVRDGLDAIAVDHAALDAGLVVVPRESVGTAADVADRVPAGTAADDARSGCGSSRSRRSSTRSSLGVPARGAGDGTPRMTAGLGPAADPDHPRAGRGDARPGRGRDGGRARAGWLAGGSRSRSALVLARDRRVVVGGRSAARRRGDGAVWRASPAWPRRQPARRRRPAQQRARVPAWSATRCCAIGARGRDRPRWRSLATLVYVRLTGGRRDRTWPRARSTRAVEDHRPIGKNCEIGSLGAVNFTVPPSSR